MQLFYFGIAFVVCSAILLTLVYKVYVCVFHMIRDRKDQNDCCVDVNQPVDVEHPTMSHSFSPLTLRRDTNGEQHFFQGSAISPSCSRRYSNASAVTVCKVHIPRRYTPPPSYEEAISQDAFSTSVPSRIRAVSMTSNA